MTVIIFLIILAVLVFVHELGHFLAAKWSGIRVDEFAIGFPPAIYKKKKGETTYSLNAIPFGGFVKIHGEDPDEESRSGPDKERSFVNKPKYLQAFVLVAGVAGNIIFAWLLICLGFMSGMPASLDEVNPSELKNPQFTLVLVGKDTPAEAAGLKAGDVILDLTSGGDHIASLSTTTEFQNFIAAHKDQQIRIQYRRGDLIGIATVTPQTGIIPEEPDRPVIGVSPSIVGTLSLPFHKAVWRGTQFTGVLIKETTIGLGQFIGRAVTGNAKLAEVTGPVGIAGLVGDASRLGFIYLVILTAFISINLAIINLIPFPALDGGRLLFVIIEKIKGSPISPKIANAMNGIGFALLIILMLVITYQDVINIFK